MRATWRGPADTSGFPGKRFTNGGGVITSTEISAWGTVPERPIIRPAPHRQTSLGKILYLRQHYHFGPGRIVDYLKRFHGVSIACASVHRILCKHGMNRAAGQPEIPAARAPLDALREGAARASL